METYVPKPIFLFCKTFTHKHIQIKAPNQNLCSRFRAVRCSVVGFDENRAKLLTAKYIRSNVLEW